MAGGYHQALRTLPSAGSGTEDMTLIGRASRKGSAGPDAVITQITGRGEAQLW